LSSKKPGSVRIQEAQYLEGSWFPQHKIRYILLILLKFEIWISENSEKVLQVPHGMTLFCQQEVSQTIQLTFSAQIHRWGIGNLHQNLEK
jgi:hypothetical protein